MKGNCPSPALTESCASAPVSLFAMGFTMDGSDIHPRATRAFRHTWRHRRERRQERTLTRENRLPNSFLVPLLWTDSPCLHPLLFRHTCRHTHERQQGLELEEGIHLISLTVLSLSRSSCNVRATPASKHCCSATPCGSMRVNKGRDRSVGN